MLGVMADAYDAMFQSNPGNVPAYAHFGSNEHSRPHETASEKRILFSQELVHNVSPKTKRRDAAEFMRTQADWVSMPSFLESEEFLAIDDPEEASRRFG